MLVILGPVERIAIPKDKDGRNRTYAFATYTSEVSVQYALNIFSGTKLFGRELNMKFRNASKNNSNQESPINTPSPLINPFQSQIMNFNMNFNMPQMQQSPQQLSSEMIRQRLLQLATMPDLQPFPSHNFNLTPQDNSGSHHFDRNSRSDSRNNDLVERSRNRREENRSNRSRPYRRSRSRSPVNNRNRDRSPPHRERRRDNRNSGGNYNRWNY